jgi:hypothetical protein
LPDSPFSVVGTIGVEDGAFTAGNEKVDWSLGLTAETYGFVLGVSYVDTNRRSIFAFEDSKAGIVFSVNYGF